MVIYNAFWNKLFFLSESKFQLLFFQALQTFPGLSVFCSFFSEPFLYFSYFFGNYKFLKGRNNEKSKGFSVYFSVKLKEKTKEKAVKTREKINEKTHSKTCFKIVILCFIKHKHQKGPYHKLGS